MDEITNVPSAQLAGKSRPPRRALLDLAPLELDCLNTLWPMGEGTVREIRDRLAERLPRAYTTIMTIMDRLARKGIVERRKNGRAYIYRANLTAEDARAQALGHVVDKFFGGSKEALACSARRPPAGSSCPCGCGFSFFCAVRSCRSGLCRSCRRHRAHRRSGTLRVGQGVGGRPRRVLRLTCHS